MKFKLAKSKIRTSWNWFSEVKILIFYFNNNVCNESKRIQNIEPQINAVVYGLPIFEIPTHERYTKWLKTKYVQISNGF